MRALDSRPGLAEPRTLAERIAMMNQAAGAARWPVAPTSSHAPVSAPDNVRPAGVLRCAGGS